MNLQKHLHCSHCYSIHFSETYTVQNNCKVVFSVILTFILIPCAHKKYIYNIYIQKKKKFTKVCRTITAQNTRRLTIHFLQYSLVPY